jgi:hypothetical protein
MDRTLRDYLDRADEIHQSIAQPSLGRSVSEVKAILRELESSIRQIQSVSHRIAHIYNSVKRKKSRSSTMRRNLEDMPMKTFPEADDWRFVSKICDESKDNAEVAPGLRINVVAVNSADEIPNVPIYWIRSTRQFGVQINGVMLVGNIGSIYQSFSKSKMAVRECRSDMCKKKNCRFFHDPNKTTSTRNTIRNFTSASWIYTDSPMSRKNMGMRHIGNRNTLTGDLYAMKLAPKNSESEINRLLSQVMHDLLVVLGANQCGLLPGNPDIPFSDDAYRGPPSGYYETLAVL